VQFVPKVSLCFWNQHKNTDHSVPILTYFKEIDLLTLDSKNPKNVIFARKYGTKNEEKRFGKQVFDIV
jgi:hypothetical protein